jgi:hypothetical protein
MHPDGANSLNANGPYLDPASRAVLGNLARAILPLDEWLKARGKNGYKPPDADELPWRRKGSELSTDRLGVIEFIESLLRESASDIFLLQRWRTLEADPLRLCPFDNKNEWRGARGLNAGARFGAVQSENIPANYGGHHVVRQQIYMDYLPLLAAAAKARNPKTEWAWKEFMLELFKDTCKQWPQGQPYRSSQFMLQLLRDILYAVLGMRNPIPEPWRSAVLTEMGEFRRPGRTYSREEIKRGVREFKDTLAKQPTSRPSKDEYELPELTKAHYLKFHNRRM